MQRLGPFDGQGQVLVLPRREEQLEVEGEMELVVRTVAEVAGQLLDRQVRLADEHAAGELRRHASEVADDVVDLGPVQAPERDPDRHRPRVPGIAPGRRSGGLSRKQLVLDGREDRVDPKAVDAAPEPEAHDIGRCLDHLGIAPVQVRLLGIERVEVELPGRTRPTPTTSHRRPRSQFDGGPPPGAGSAQMYQSRFGLSRDERDSTNHGCSIEVWHGTRSMSRRSPRSWQASMSASRSASVPNSGATSV